MAPVVIVAIPTLPESPLITNLSAPVFDASRVELNLNNLFVASSPCKYIDHP